MQKWQRYLLALFLMAFVHGLTPHAIAGELSETRCLDNTAPYLEPYLEKGYSLEEAWALIFIRDFVVLRNNGSLYQNSLSSFGDFGLACEPPPGNGRSSECRRFEAFTTYTLPAHEHIDAYAYSVDVKEIHVVRTSCNAQGTCTRTENLDYHGACVTAVRTPYTVSITGSSEKIDKELTPVDLTVQVTHLGAPVTRHRIELAQSDLGKHGNLRCKSACSGSDWITDSEGRVFLEYVPRRRSVDPITFTASCTDCDGSGEWTVKGGRDLLVGFFNGVANTDTAAQKSLDRLRTEFGDHYQDANIFYDWFYNQTDCRTGAIGKSSCLEDVAEVFGQRTEELGGVMSDRWEVFWDILAGRHREENSLAGRMLGLLGNAGNALLQWIDGTFNLTLNQLAQNSLDLLTIFTTAPTALNQAGHLQRLTQYADEELGMVLIAHSQGNLFVNQAFDGLKASHPASIARVVHIAPASPTLRGDYLLASIDLVINALRVTGINTVPMANITLPPSSKDPSGHGFEPTYLDTSRAAYGRSIAMITSALDGVAN